MKIDYISSAKILYFAEKLLENGHGQVSGNLAQLMDMTAKEINFLIDQVDHEKLIHLNEFSVESEDKYGSFNSEFTYESNVVDKEKVEKFIEWIKERYSLKESPFLSRKIIVLISSEIEQIFDKKQLIKILNSFPDSDYVIWQFSDGTYSLADILLKYAYGKDFAPIVAEFINPIYYGIGDRDKAVNLFHYLNHILLTGTEKENYNQWLQATSRYLPEKTKVNVESQIAKVEIANLSELLEKRDTDKNNRIKFPYKLAAGTTWSNIVITFSDDESVVISVLKKVHETDYANMGFLDRRSNTPRPNKDWFFLKLLAKVYGELTTDDRERDDSYKKQKQTLSESLKYYFSISDDPFYPYNEYISDTKKSNSYKIRLTLFYPEKERPKEVKSYLGSLETEIETPEEKFEREIKENFDEQLTPKNTQKRTIAKNR